jgi:hypothetical protein
VAVFTPYLLRGRAVVQMMEALRYKSEGREFDFRWGYLLLPAARWFWHRLSL